MIPFYCSTRIKAYLSTFLKICIFYGYLPATCFRTVILPVANRHYFIKNNNADVSDVNNYCPIGVSTIFSKLFEKFVFKIVILDFILSHLLTNDNQIRFKAKHGAELCAFLLKGSIVSYVNHSASVYAALG